MFSSISREQIWLILVSFTLCSFAFSERINSWGIILLVVFFVADKQLYNKLKLTSFNKKILPLLSFFVIYLLFYFVSSHNEDAYHALLSKLSFLILPLLFSYENYFSPQNEKKIFQIFCVVLAIGFFYGLGVSFYANYFMAAKPSLSAVFFRMKVSNAIMHPGYYSNYFMFAIIWLSYTKKVENWFFILLFTVILYFLVSRTVLLFYVLFSVYRVFDYLTNLKKSWKFKAAFVLSCILLFLLFVQLPNIQKRLSTTIANINNTSKNTTIISATSSRRIAYAQQISLIVQQPVYGYGLGNSIKVLKQNLIQTGYGKLAEKMHNHNQYFKTYLELGIAGFCMLIFLLLFLLRYYSKNGMQVPLGFTVLVILLLFTDDMLEIQAGIVFFVLVWSLYLCRVPRTSS